MDFAHSPRTLELRDRLQRFMDDLILPSDPGWRQYAEAGVYPTDVVEPLKAKAKEAGLWNLFLPGLRDDEPGTRMSNLEYAPLAELMGKVPWSPEIFNCNPPDTGNMELLHLFGTAEQRERWLKPLLAGEIRSCYAMTEPDVASSDATNVQTRIAREGDDLVINGRKWFITGANHPNCRVMIVLGLSDSCKDAPTHQRHSMVMVPMDTPGVEIVRNLPIMQHLSIEGHCEIVLRDVRVPVTSLIGKEGEGFALAQARLGPGRTHLCMRTIGQCELALALMCDRAIERKTFGQYIGDFANVQDWIAHSRVEIDQARLLVLRAAWLMDQKGNRAARIDVSAIKLVTAQLGTRVIDRAIQVFGGMGLTPDTPLAWLYSWNRAFRFLDGPDEVHSRVIARQELNHAKANRNAHTGYFRRWMPPERIA